MGRNWTGPHFAAVCHAVPCLDVICLDKPATVLFKPVVMGGSGLQAEDRALQRKTAKEVWSNKGVNGEAWSQAAASEVIPYQDYHRSLSSENLPKQLWPFNSLIKESRLSERQRSSFAPQKDLDQFHKSTHAIQTKLIAYTASALAYMVGTGADLP